MRAAPLAAWAFGAVGMLAFSGTLPATRIAIVDYDPWTISAMRAGIAGLLSILWLLWIKPPRPRGAGEWLRMAGFSLCVGVGFPLLINIGMETAPASHGGVVLALLPLASAVFGALVGGERPSPMFWLCASAAAAVVLAFALREGGGGFSAGHAPLFAAVAAAGLGYTLGARLTRRLGGAATISWALALLFPLAAPLALWRGVETGLGGFEETAALLYLALISQWFGYFAWNRGMALGGVARIAQMQHLQTFLTLALAALIVGETLEPDLWAFAAAATLFVLMGSRARVQRTSDAQGNGEVMR